MISKTPWIKISLHKLTHASWRFHLHFLAFYQLRKKSSFYLAKKSLFYSIMISRRQCYFVSIRPAETCLTGFEFSSTPWHPSQWTYSLIFLRATTQLSIMFMCDGVALECFVCDEILQEWRTGNFKVARELVLRQMCFKPMISFIYYLLDWKKKIISLVNKKHQFWHAM